MVLLCFVLDLRNISPPLLGSLKQSLLQLANLYAISSRSDSLTDRIGLCYVLKDRISGCDQLKIAYSPSGNFSLRDFHHAVNGLPMDAFVPEINESGAISCSDFTLSSILSIRALYSWGGKDIMRKTIVLSSCVPENIDSETRSTLMDAADKCVSVEFLFLERKTSHLSYVQERINRFLRCISDLDNCSFQTCLSDAKAFHGLVKRWLQDLNDDMGEPQQARFIFKSNLVGSLNKVFCNLSAAVNQIIDGFNPCQTCRCHGVSLDDTVEHRTERLSCPITSLDLGTCDVIENSVKVGDRTILFLPSFQVFPKLQPISSHINFNVIERTNLSSLSEGVIMGAPYIVSPSACHEMESASEETDQSDLNTQIFQGLCCALYSMDQGLLCSSNFNMETMRAGAFHCYYILQPSENGPMLLRRLAGSEEVLPICEVSRFTESAIPGEIENSVKDSLLKIESTDYNPLAHERGFHQKLNTAMKESLQFGSVPPKLNDTTFEVSSTVSDSLQVTAQSFSDSIMAAEEEETHQLDQKAEEEDKTTACITEEWEQLVVIEVPRKSSPQVTTPKSNMGRLVLSPVDSKNKQIDIKTSRILERLEVPRQIRGKIGSPATVASGASLDMCFLAKKPLIPFQTSASDQPASSSQLMKPNFQRLKRKHR